MQAPSAFSPQLIVHLFAALSATLLGPIALWARWRGHRPKLHRAFGYAWVTMMLATAITSLFITSNFPVIGSYSWIHVILTPATLIALFLAFRHLARKNIRAHQLTMAWLYVGACLVAGAFTLLPGRFLGQLLWG